VASYCDHSNCEYHGCSGLVIMSSERRNLESDRAPIYWIHEAIRYLGLDRLGLARPDLAIHRLIRKGALHPKKICGRLVFDKRELDLVASVGDQKRGRGRPNKFV